MWKYKVIIVLTFLSAFFMVRTLNKLSSFQALQEASLHQLHKNVGSSSSSISDGNGWSSIYVYHGNDEFEEDRTTSQFVIGSQVKQDRIILALTEKIDSATAKNEPHFFVDLAANDAELLSNTLLLEENGWKGICIEPNPIYWYHLAKRKCAVAGAFVGGVEDMVPVNVKLDNGVYGGIIGKDLDNKQASGKIEKRYTVSLLTVFDKFHVPHTIDYLSLDVEGAESLVMEDFPFADYQFKLMTVERPKADLKVLLNEHGYIYVMDLSSWGETLWVNNKTIAEAGIQLDEIKTIVHEIK
jgi:hypothetical protein